MSNETDNERIVELENLCDLTLVAGNDGTRIPVRRNIMASANNYFTALLGPSFKEANENEIELKNIDGPTLKLLIDFCYTGNIEFTSDNVYTILAAASSFGFVQIEQKCCEYLERNLTIENWVQHMLIADKYSLKDLHGKIFDFIAENFSKIYDNDELQLLDEKCALKLFNSDKINALEEEVFYAVRDWIDNKGIKCSELITNLFNCVRLEYIPEPFLTTSIEDFSKLHNCQKPVLDECKRRVFSQETTRPNRDRTFGNWDILCCYQTNIKTIISLKKYDIVMNKWEHYISLDLNFVVTCPEIVCYEDKIYVMGGLDPKKFAVRSMTSLDLSNLEIRNLPEMIYKKYGFTSVVLDGWIYIIGGHDDEIISCTNCCERFDTKLLRWNIIKPMQSKRYGHASAHLNGNIYTAGGKVGSFENDLKTVECYSPITNKWNFIAEMNRPRVAFSLLALNGFLYAMGNHYTVERYDPRMDVWTTIGSFNTSGIISIVSSKGGIFGLFEDGSFNKYSPTMNNCTRLNGFTYDDDMCEWATKKLLAISLEF